MQKPKKDKVSYLCTECGDSFAKWYGQCPSCKAWNSLSENRFVEGPAGASAGPAEGAKLITSTVTAEPLVKTGLKQFDQILGGGVMAGAVILIGGEPGIGK